MRGPLTAGLILCAFAASARADAVLSTVRGEDISEGAYTLAIDLRGLDAVVDVRQTLVNPSATDAEAIYAFDLPSSAVVDGASIDVAGKREEVAFGADAAAAISPAPSDDDVRGSVPDAVMVHVVDHQTGDAATGAPDLTRYELRVFPVAARKAVTVRTRFVIPLEVADGRVILRLPSRGDAANLSRETGEVRFHAAGGIVGYDHVHVDDGDATPAGGVVRFAHSRRGALVLDATPRVHGTDPLVWFDTMPLDGKRGSVAVSIFVPRQATTERLPFDRIELLVDTSRSMAGATDGAARVVDAVLADAAPSVEVQAILFDRVVRPVGPWRANDAAMRADLGKAIREATLANGTNLPDAMSAAGLSLGEPDGTRTLVVVVTDGLIPIGTSGLELVQRLGAPRPGLTASFVLVTPDGAALPDILHGPLADVAHRTGGMILASRAGEVTSRAKAMATELGLPAPIHDVALTGVDAVSGLEVPESLAAGSGTVALGWYAGAPPTRISLVGARGERPIRVTGRRAVQVELGDLALAAVDPSAVATHAPDAEPSDKDTEAANDLVAQARRRRGVVTDATSLVAIDSRSPFAVERRKLAVGGGPFMRVSPPGESRVRATVPQVRVGTVRLRGDLDARLIHDMIETGLVPRARACFQPLLLKQRQSEGTIHLDLELSRGELTEARVAQSDFPSDVNKCLIEAAYELDVPRTLLDDLPDTVYLVHYPLTFRSLAAGELILPGDADSDDPIDTGVHVPDPDQPLGGVVPPP